MVVSSPPPSTALCRLLWCPLPSAVTPVLDSAINAGKAASSSVMKRCFIGEVGTERGEDEEKDA